MRPASHTEAFNQRAQDIERLTRERDVFASKAASLECSLSQVTNASLAEREAALKSVTEVACGSREAAGQTQHRASRNSIAIWRSCARRVASASAATLRLEGRAGRTDQSLRRRPKRARWSSNAAPTSTRRTSASCRTSSRSSLRRSTELEGDLRAAEDAINRLEAELRTKSTKLEELTQHARRVARHRRVRA